LEADEDHPCLLLLQAVTDVTDDPPASAHPAPGDDDVPIGDGIDPLRFLRRLGIGKRENLNGSPIT
jgi:hypothetical protein